MSIETDRLLSVEEARRGVVEAIGGPVDTETIATAEALGRVLAAPVVAAVSLPPWDNSAMDGYAVRAADTMTASEDAPSRLSVTGDVPAGRAATEAVQPGAAFRIATGAPVPAGADAVVQVESTTPLDADGRPGDRGRDASGPLPAAILVQLLADVPEPETVLRMARGPVVNIVNGSVWLGVGLFALWRRPDNPLGLIMAAVGAAILLVLALWFGLD